MIVQTSKTTVKFSNYHLYFLIQTLLRCTTLRNIFILIYHKIINFLATNKGILSHFYAPRRISGEHIVAASSVRPYVRVSVRPSRSCPRKFSETACRISMKLHGNIKYQRWMRISPACSGSMIFPRVIALWWVLHEYIGYCSCPREFSETTSRISLKLHGNIKYGRWMCISPACSGSMIFPRVIALWWVLHEYIGYCSCPRKFLANTGRNSTKF